MRLTQLATEAANLVATILTTSVFTIASLAQEAATTSPSSPATIAPASVPTQSIGPEPIAAEMQSRLDDLIKRIKALAKPTDEEFKAVDDEVIALATELENVAPRRAGNLLLAWSNDCREVLLRPHAALRGYAETARILAASGEESSLGMIACNRGLILQSLSRFDDALEAYAQAETIFRKLGDEGSLAVILGNRGMVLRSLSRFEEALVSYAQAEDVFRRLGNERNLARIDLYRGGVLHLLLRVDDALAAYARAAEVYRKLRDDGGAAKVAVGRGNILKSLSRFAEALDAYAQADATYRRLEDEGGIATVAQNRGSVLHSLSRFEDALEAYAQAESVYRKREDEYNLGGIALNRGNVFESLSRFEEALESYDHAEAIFRKLGVESRLALIAMNRGNVFYSLSRFEEALVAYTEAESVFRKLGEDSHFVAVVQNRAKALESLTRYAEALEAFAQAEAVARKLGDERSLAGMAQNRGSILSGLSLFEDASAAYAEAESIFRKLGDEDSLARITLTRGDVFQSLSRFEDALVAYTEAESIFRRLGSEGDVARVAISRGGVFQSLSRFEEALESYAQAEAVVRKLGDERDLATVVLNRGVVLESLARFDEALEAFAQADSVFLKLGDRRGRATVALNRGALLQSLSRSEESLQSYRQAEEVFRELGDEGRVATVALNRGVAFQSVSRFEDALQAFAEAERVFQKLGDEGCLAMILANRGNVFQALSRFVDALDAYARAETVLQKLGDERNLAQIAVNRGVVFESLERFDEALHAYEAWTSLFEGLMIRQVAAIGDESSRTFRGISAWMPATVAGTAISDRQTDDGKSVERRARGARIAFRCLEILSGRSVVEGMGHRDVASFEQSLDEEERRRLGELRVEARQLLGRRDELAKKRDSEEALEKVVARIQALDREERAMAEKVRLLHPVATSGAYPRASTPEEIRAALPTGAAFIELAVAEELAWGFVITNDQFELVALGDAKELLEAIEKLRRNVADGLSPETVLRKVGRLALDPILAFLPKDKERRPKTIFFALQGELAQLPMEMLLTSDAPPGSDPKIWPYLIRDFDVAYVPSGSTLVAMRQQAKIDREWKADAPDFFAVGFPFDHEAEADEEGVDLPSSEIAMADPVLRGGERRVLYRTADEVLGVATLFARDDAERGKIKAAQGRLAKEPHSRADEASRIDGERFRLLMRAHANEKSFKNDPMLRESRIVHLACHGEADLTSPVLSRLVLAQSKALQDSTGEDGFLYLREIEGLSLKADLLVLSACATNDGVLHPAEGIQGLNRAGLLAGARAVLSTLWRVNDKAARDLVLDFYRRWLEGGSTRIHALSEAKRAAIAAKMPLRTWSGYVLWDVDAK